MPKILLTATVYRSMCSPSYLTANKVSHADKVSDEQAESELEMISTQMQIINIFLFLMCVFILSPLFVFIITLFFFLVNQPRVYRLDNEYQICYNFAEAVI